MDVLQLAVAESGIIAPAAVKKFVSFNAHGREKGVGLVIEQTIPELGQASLRASRDDLVEGIEGIESSRGHSRFGVSGAAKRSGPIGVGRARRNGENGLTLGLKWAGGGRRQLIVRFHVLIKHVGVENHLIPEDLAVGTEVTAVALRLREGK